MLNKFLLFMLAFLSSWGFSNIDSIKDEDNLVHFINENIETLREQYYLEYGEEWNVSHYVNHHRLYDENNQLKAYMIVFDQGYITVGLDFYLYEINTNNQIPFYVENERNYLIGSFYYIQKNNRFIPNSDGAPDIYTLDGQSLFYDDIYKSLTSTETNKLKNFKITHSIANDLATSNQSYGSYNIYTRTQGSNMDCGAQAAINIVYTYELSGITGIAKSQNSNNELSTMRTLMNWSSAGRSYLGVTFYGIWPSEITSGLNSYLSSNYRIFPDGMFGSGINAPAIGLYYSLSVVETAHYAMIIGSAQSDAWWVFKTNYDIISHWSENYNHSSGVIGTKKSGTPSYYFVETQYRNGTYNVMRSTGAQWWEIWKPAWVLLTV